MVKVYGKKKPGKKPEVKTRVYQGCILSPRFYRQSVQSAERLFERDINEQTHDTESKISLGKTKFM